jgi:hypothetical protein
MARTVNGTEEIIIISGGKADIGKLVALGNDGKLDLSVLPEIAANSQWLNGNVNPGSEIGAERDYYLNTATGDVFQKSKQDAWVLIANLKGPQGMQGPKGDNGDSANPDWNHLKNIPPVLTKLSDNNGNLMYNGKAVDTAQAEHSIVLCGAGVQLQYPWSGMIQSIQVLCQVPPAADIKLAVQIQTAADYANRAGNWRNIGNQVLSFPANTVYQEYLLTDTITAGDIIQANLPDGTSDHITIQVKTKNT